MILKINNKFIWAFNILGYVINFYEDNNYFENISN